MLTYQDCLDLCHLTQEEIDAVAEHEHTDPLHAMAKAEQMISMPGGDKSICRMIIDDIRHAQSVGNHARETELKKVLTAFIKSHRGAEAHRDAF